MNTQIERQFNDGEEGEIWTHTHELPRYYQFSKLEPYLLGLPLHTVLSAFHRVETIGALDLAARIKQ